MKHRFHIVIWMIFIIFVSLAETQERIALVIGNSKYEKKKLPNTINDARLIGNTIRNLGFDTKIEEDATQEKMNAYIEEFVEKLRKKEGSIGLFYYAGHGIQHQGRVYLVPIGAISKAGYSKKLEDYNVSLDLIIKKISNSGTVLNIIIIDACRTSPFPPDRKDGEEGLAKAAYAEGTIIAYATAPDKVASDGKEQNSPYTKHLAQLMQVPRMPIEIMLRKVRERVRAETGDQTPWYDASIEGDFYFSDPFRALSQFDVGMKVLVPSDAKERFVEIDKVQQAQGKTALSWQEPMNDYVGKAVEIINIIPQEDKKIVSLQHPDKKNIWSFWSEILQPIPK